MTIMHTITARSVRRWNIQQGRVKEPLVQGLYAPNWHPTKKRTLGRLRHFDPDHVVVNGYVRPGRRAAAKSFYEWLISVLWERFRDAHPIKHRREPEKPHWRNPHQGNRECERRRKKKQCN